MYVEVYKWSPGTMKLPSSQRQGSELPETILIDLDWKSMAKLIFL